MACQQRQIGEGFYIVGAAGVLGNAHRPENHTVLSLGIKPGRFNDLLSRNVCDARRPFWRPSGHRPGQCLIALRSAADKSLIQPAIMDDDVGHGVEDGHICARFVLEVEMGEVG